MRNRFLLNFSVVLAVAALSFLSDRPGRSDSNDNRLQSGSPARIANSAEAKLSTVGSWNLTETPVSDFVVALRDRLAINVILDLEALNEEGIASDSPITMELRDVKLDLALRLILKPLALGFYFHRDVLVVTTLAKEQEYLTTSVYPVYDLVVFKTPEGELVEDYQSLIRIIEEETSGAWESVDGEGGTITEFANSGAVAIRQTWSVHREIRGLLAALRKAKRLQNLPDIPVATLEAEAPPQGAGFVSVEEEADDVIPSHEESVPVSSSNRQVPPAKAWQIPRIDRAD